MRTLSDNQRAAYRVLRGFGWSADVAIAKVRDGSGLEIAARWKQDAADGFVCVDSAIARIQSTRNFYASHAAHDVSFADVVRHIWKREYGTCRAVIARRYASQS